MLNKLMKKYVIHFVGYSCTGKSALEKALKEKLPGWYVVSYDKLKWQLAGYDRTKDAKLIKEITKGLFEVICKLGNSILALAMISTEEEYVYYKQIATQYEYEFISIEVTAPKEVLLARFRERVKTAKLMKSTTLSVTDESVFLENISKPFFIPQNITSFDTSILKPEEIAEKIIEQLGNNGATC